MLTTRQQVILNAIVEQYIKTKQPVGSKYLLNEYGLPYSSATIRNDMVVLEDLGFLEKAHISSGRIPSDKGYRFYVDTIENWQIEEDVKNRLAVVFSNRQQTLNEVIQESCEILSELTNLTSVVLGSSSQKEKLRKITLIPLDEMQVTAIIITNKGHVESKVFNINRDVSMYDLENCVSVLNDSLIDTPISDLLYKLETVVLPELEDKVQHYDLLFKAFTEAFVKFAGKTVSFTGTSNMLNQPEFSNIEKIRKVMQILDNKNAWNLLSSFDDGLIIQIGSENNDIVQMNELSIVSSSYKLDNHQGKIAVIGPTRMEYNKVIALLEYVTSEIENWFK